jgi:heptosyltransferase-2
VPELVALLARARMVVSNDSGAAHVASAVGTPVVSVFGSTVPGSGYAAYGPRARTVERADLACRPCGRHGFPACPLGHFRCMREVPAAQVIARLDELLVATAPARGARPFLAGTQPHAGIAPG